MDKQARKSLLEGEPVNSCIIRARCISQYAKTTMKLCYTPTEQAPEEKKDLFSSNLQEQMEKTPQHDILIVMGGPKCENGVI